MGYWYDFFFGPTAADYGNDYVERWRGHSGLPSDMNLTEDEAVFARACAANGMDLNDPIVRDEIADMYMWGARDELFVQDVKTIGEAEKKNALD